MRGGDLALGEIAGLDIIIEAEADQARDGRGHALGPRQGFVRGLK